MLDPKCLELNGDNAQLSLIPAIHGPVTQDDIMGLLSLPEFSALFPLEQAINRTIANINSLCHQAAGQVPLQAIIAERRHGSLGLTISQDNMQASLSLTAPWGGKAIDLPQILVHLKQHK
ncbi:MAG: DUF342 domain-containing protein, partial [Shewanella sp.]